VVPKVISDEAVYRATLRVLEERGYAGATTRLIAEAAEINEATLFRKYGSKPALVVASVRESAFAVDESATAYTGDLVQDLLRAAEGYATALERGGHLFALIMTELARYPELRQTMRGPQSVTRRLAGLIAQYQHEGALVTEEDPLQAVASFLGPLIVTNLLQSAKPEGAPGPVDLEAHVRRFAKARS
jgi:AcrR family transcriptional regulator